ncbi:hypothetical protein BCR37DRAFT_391838 [Protomyces lactucae-debilis]|uniref:F-box domain-containing protein n=1 Tax=Protomyces lactucae-debilis TaxID=2754530 RepID=A0A1Y2FND2_PROLT|nr:uncharacterized protein BCR37DRAFT_391838 [Protomyces lactucae-debilis]ORY84235.1 hypothetical protein BCR37DRAFT_391838 [Protomyces lactucae-debilis]
MSVPNLPIEVWWQILSFSDKKTLWALRCVSRAFLRRVEDTLVPESLNTDWYRMYEKRCIDLEEDSPKWRCEGESPVHALNGAAIATFLYAPFRLSQRRSDWDLELYNWLSRDSGEDVAALRRRANHFSLAKAKVLSIHRNVDMEETLEDLPEMFEQLVLGRPQIRRHIIVSEDGQSLLVPIYLLWTRHFELVVQQEDLYDPPDDYNYGRVIPLILQHMHDPQF